MNVGSGGDGGATIAPHVRRSKVLGVKMSSTSSRFSQPSCKFRHIMIK